MIRVLVVDDEAPAVAELRYLLGKDPRVREVIGAQTGEEAFRALDEHPIDLVFLDIHMPGLSGLEVARVLKRFATPPQLVFVTADDSHALEAYDLAAVDYLLKPVRPERLAEAVRRASEERGEGATVAGEAPRGPARSGASAPPSATGAQGQRVRTETSAADPAQGPSIVVAQAGADVRVRLSEITHVTAAGDYARLHTRRGTFLERTPLSELEVRWADAGFVRIHRSALVSLDHVTAVARVEGKSVVRIGTLDLPVARRSAARVREAFALRADDRRRSRGMPSSPAAGHASPGGRDHGGAR